MHALGDGKPPLCSTGVMTLKTYFKKVRNFLYLREEKICNKIGETFTVRTYIKIHT